MIDVENKTILIGIGDILFQAMFAGDIRVHQIKPPGIPGERPPEDADLLATIAIPYNANFDELHNECMHLVDTRQTGEDMSSYFAGGAPLMLGEFSIKFYDMKFNRESIRVLIATLNHAINAHCALCAV